MIKSTLDGHTVNPVAGVFPSKKYFGVPFSLNHIFASGWQTHEGAIFVPTCVNYSIHRFMQKTMAENLTILILHLPFFVQK